MPTAGTAFTRSAPRRGRLAQSGRTVIEVIIAAALLAFVVGGTVHLLSTSRQLAISSADQHLCDMRTERGLAAIERDLRQGSLASIQHLDGTTFADGDSGAGLTFLPVTGWSGAAVLGDPIEYRLDLPSGETEGDLVRSVAGIETTLATGVTEFTATRTGQVFAFTLSTRAGPDDDRGRSSSGTLSVVTRNR